ncbi:MAG: DUF1080 domain-containing protein [Gemmatimonadota bacterium]|jgi:hypothetical protein
MKRFHLLLTAALLAACTAPAADATNHADAGPAAADSAPQPKPEDTEIWEPEPTAVTPGTGTAAPSDAIVLFDGTDLSGWSTTDGGDAGWKVEDGVMTVVAGSGDIQTRESFGSVQLHIEWRTPAQVSGEGQGRGNSGVYLMAKYELQVLDSWDNRTYSNGQAGSIYKQYAPLVNASRPPGQWQTYDVIFDAPRFAADGALLRPAFMTVLQNGVLVQDHAELRGPTLYIGSPEWEAHQPELPILLQDHGNPVSYRNIWVRRLHDRAAG